jgi:2-desacetyl-2-hydroxyethyl bacteriochlorophyllide A dehydrogenase
MRAVRLQEPGRIEVEEVPEPHLEEQTDAIVRVTSSAICGSDLHLYHGKVPGIEPGLVCGHEFLGEVVEIGSSVLDVEVGERYVSSMFTACGRCPACIRHEHRRCARFGMFGYGMAFGDLAGGQADLVRVPFADMALAPLPEGVSDDAALLTSDILSTAFTALRRGPAGPGDVVAVIGAGPLGQLAIMLAPLFGVAKVISVDVVPERLKEAEALGAIPVDARTDDVFDAVFDHTSNQGADLVIEAAGNGVALKTALDVVRTAGRVSLVGVLVDEPLPITAGDVFLRGLTITGMVGEPLRDRAELLSLIAAGRIDPARVISHHMPLDQATEAYSMFEDKKATKIVLQP